MNISTQKLPGWLELSVEGRLDAAWATLFTSTVADLVRVGSHTIRVDASKLEYISSAGLRALLKARKDLESVHGTFSIIRASNFVLKTLSMSGFAALLSLETEAESATPRQKEELDSDHWEKGGMAFELHDLDPDATLDVACQGGWKPWNTIDPEDCRNVALGREVFGIGTGAPGPDYESARERMGDYAAAAGCVALLPGTGADAPDYLVEEGSLTPEILAATALTARGGISHLLRFQPASGTASLPMTSLMDSVLAAAGTTAAAFVVIAEVEGLVGMSTLRSPALATGPDTGSFPEVREWVAFCGERVHAGALTLIVGFVDASGTGRDIPGLPILPSRSPWRAHAHAVVFPFRPLPKGKIDMEQTVRQLFGAADPVALLHLVEDNRQAVGLGQSALIRGACWCSPAHFSEERK